MQIGPTVIRLVNIRNRVLWNLAKDKNNFQESVSENVKQNLLRLKRQTSGLYTLIACFILMAPCMVFIVYQLTASQRFLNGCTGCDLILTDRNFFTSFAFGLCFASVIALRRLKKMHNDLKEYVEIKTYLQVCLFLGVAHAVSSRVIEWPSSLNNTLFIHCCAIAIQYMQGVKPLVQGIQGERKLQRKKIEPSSHSTSNYSVNGEQRCKPKCLVDILHTNEGLEAFTDHVTQEYNVENVKFWHDVAIWKRDYTLNRASPIDLKKRAFNIFDTYIPNSALLQVNLDDLQRGELEKAFEQARDDDQLVDMNIFDEAQEEILHLMNCDSYPRFKSSPLYENFLAEKWPTAEEW